MIIQVLLFWLSSQIIYHLCLSSETLGVLITRSDTYFKCILFLRLNEFIVGILGGFIFMKHPINIEYNTDVF